MYVQETGCPFPVYTDPTRKLYSDLGMVRSLAPGSRPAYMRRSLLSASIASVFQGLRQLKKGLAMKAGDQRQIGGEFLFEPLSIMTPTDEVDRQMGQTSAMIAKVAAGGGPVVGRNNNNNTDGTAAADGGDGSDPANAVEEKRVTWCHRMRTTRDHAEIPELMEVLGLDGQGEPAKDKKRWSRALETRKGTGLSLASQMSGMQGRAGGT